MSGLAEYHFSNIINAVNFRVVGLEDTDDIARLRRGQKGAVNWIGISLFPHTHVVMAAIDTRMIMPGIMPKVSKTKGIDRTPRPI